MQLPYTTQPKEPTIALVGNITIGILNMLSYGYIREAEQRQLEDIDFELANNERILRKLAQKIAEAEKMDEEVAYDLVIKANNQILTEFFNKYSEGYGELETILKSFYKSKIEKLTIFLKERCCDENGNKALAEWTIEDTERELQNPKLIEAIEAFILNERNGGKLPKEPKNPSPSKKNLTDLKTT